MNGKDNDGNKPDRASPESPAAAVARSVHAEDIARAVGTDRSAAQSPLPQRLPDGLRRQTITSLNHRSHTTRLRRPPVQELEPPQMPDSPPPPATHSPAIYSPSSAEKALQQNPPISSSTQTTPQQTPRHNSGGGRKR